jgi:hypothetical protein
MDQFNASMKRAQELKESNELPDSTNAAAEAAAHSAANQFHSDEFQQHLSAEKKESARCCLADTPMVLKRRPKTIKAH